MKVSVIFLCFSSLIFGVSGCKKSDVSENKPKSTPDTTITVTPPAQPDTGWQQVASLPGPRAFGTGFSLNNAGYVGGGVSNVNSYGYDDMYMYDPVKDTWTKKNWLPILAADPNVGRYMPFSFTINNKIYAGGGNSPDGSGRDVEVYNPVADTWTLVAQLDNTHFFNASMATSFKNIGYIISYDPGNLLFWSFDPSTNKITSPDFNEDVTVIGNSWLGSSDVNLFYGFAGTSDYLESIDPVGNTRTFFPGESYPLLPQGDVVTKVGIFYKNGMYVSFGDAGHLYCFNLKTRSWNNVITRNLGITEGVSTFLIGSKLYMAGGTKDLLSTATDKVYAIDLNLYPQN